MDLTTANRPQAQRGPIWTAQLLLACTLLSGPLVVAAASEAAAARVARVQSQVTVARVADLIENHYFDATRGRAIATSLRSAAHSGEFDTFRQARDLANGLTQLLHPLDHHFRVFVSTGSEQRWTRGGPPGLADASAVERRSAFGFRRVEMLPGAIGYIDLRSFAYLAPGKRDDPARGAANAALQLVQDANAVIIDLRENIGGSSDMAAYLISAFTPAGNDVYDVIHWRNGTDSERPTLPYPQPRVDVPLYLLISARTASAAEATAYALHAIGRAVIVGETSAGAANVGGMFPVGSDLSVFVPIGTPINPVTGGNWEGTGIPPDVHIAAQAALPRAERLALETVLRRNPSGSQAAYTRRVLETLDAAATPRAGPPLRDYVGVYSGVAVTTAGDLLALRQDKRMPSVLVRLNADTFFDRDDPSKRIVFERGAQGTVAGVRMIYANGHELWFPARAMALAPLQLPERAGAP